MYKVSEQYKAAMQRPVQSYRMRGTIGNTVFGDSHILSGSFSITNQCSDETQVLIGQVYIAVQIRQRFLSLARFRTDTFTSRRLRQAELRSQ